MEKKKISVKSPNIKLIFEKMSYGEVTESTSLAKVWLDGHKEILSFVDNQSNGCKDSSVGIKDVNTGENLCTVFAPKKANLQKIIHTAKHNNLWISKTPYERANLINTFAEEIEKNSALICQLEVCVRGILSIDTKIKALPFLIDYLRYYSSWAANSKFSPNVGSIAVAVNFIAENSFLGFLGCILGPALAAGYNVLVQASSKISPVVLLIIELAERVGIPEGTLKIVPGKVDNDSVFQSENVDVISSVGYNSSELTVPVDKTFLAITNSKSSMIIFNSADIDSACESVIDAAWGYQGLLPWSINTLLVQEDVFQNVLEKLKYRLSKVRIGLAIDKTVELSYPSDTTVNKQLHILINEAKMQGVEVFQSIDKTDMFQPTLLIGGRVFNNNVIRDDDYTSVLTVVAFRTASEAVNLSNNSRYGFATSIWTENIGLANEVAKGLNVSNIWVNSHGLFTASAAFSPYKKSGYGIFGGPPGFYEFAAAVIDSAVVGNAEGDAGKSLFNISTGNDINNIVALAKKGSQSWSKILPSIRNQSIKDFANNINTKPSYFSKLLNCPENEVQLLVRMIFSLPIRFQSGTTAIYYPSQNLQIHYEPVGVVVIEATDEKLDSLLILVLSSILLGNAVIILCYSDAAAHLWKELSKILSDCNIAAGVCTVIPSANVIKSALFNKDVGLYISNCKNNVYPKIVQMQHFYNGPLNLKQIFNRVMLIKNVWFNVGESVV